jgi:hypothetical protein
MGVLKAKSRNALPSKDFGLPDTRQYPIENKAHARDALARDSEELAKGKLTPAQAAQIRHRADVVLGETDSNYHNHSKK